VYDYKNLQFYTTYTDHIKHAGDVSLNNLGGKKTKITAFILKRLGARGGAVG